jgi:hypothetical protein
MWMSVSIRRMPRSHFQASEKVVTRLNNLHRRMELMSGNFCTPIADGVEVKASVTDISVGVVNCEDSMSESSE